MIEYCDSDIFQTECQAVVIPVNTCGVMGNGLALAFANRVPGLLERYQQACRANAFRNGSVFIYKGRLDYGRGRDIVCVCFATKHHWSNPSRYEWIDEGLNSILTNYRRWGIGSIAIPAIGCGKGGLDWEVVKVMIENYFKESLLVVDVYPPK